MKKSVTIIGAGISGLSCGALLASENISVNIYEKMPKVGGRTTSTVFRNYVLDNGFHIMTFYKKSAIFQIFRKLGISDQLKLIKVKNMAFYQNGQFFNYPDGITGLLNFSLLSFQDRLKLLSILLPMALSTLKNTEKYDNMPLSEKTKGLSKKAQVFFDAICILAFADIQERVSLGEFMRMLMKVNPFAGGNSDLAYPQIPGYDTISKILAKYIQSSDTQSQIFLNHQIKRVLVENGKVVGIIDYDGKIINTTCVVISLPAYLAINQLFDENIIKQNTREQLNKYDKTTSVIEIHFALSKSIEKRQIIFPIGDDFTAKGIFFVSNISNSVAPKGEQLLLVGCPVTRDQAMNSDSLKKISEKMKSDISKIYPDFQKYIIWEKTMSWNFVESVVKEPGLVWKQKIPYQILDIKGLFFIGDSTISYGIGTDSAAHSAILCSPKIIDYLSKDN